MGTNAADQLQIEPIHWADSMCSVLRHYWPCLLNQHIFPKVGSTCMTFNLITHWVYKLILQKKKKSHRVRNTIYQPYLCCDSAASGGPSVSCAWRAGSGTRPWVRSGRGNCPESAASGPPPILCLGQWLRIRKRVRGTERSKVRVAATARGPLNFKSDRRRTAHNNHKYSLWCLIIWFHFMRHWTLLPHSSIEKKSHFFYVPLCSLLFLLAFEWFHQFNIASSLQGSCQCCSPRWLSLTLPDEWLQNNCQCRKKRRSSRGRVGGMIVSFSSQTASKSAHVEDFLTARSDVGARSLWGDLSRAPPLSLNLHY